MASALINVPAKAKRGEIIEIKTLMSHIMETGYRHTADGEVVPRDIITSFSCRYNGIEIFRADLFPAIAANPFITFFTIGDRERQIRIRMDRRQGICRNRVGLDNGRMKFAGIIVVAALLIAAPPAGALKSRRPSAAPATSFMAPDTRAMQNDDTTNPGMLWVLDGEKLWNAQGRARRARPAPIATRMRASA